MASTLHLQPTTKSGWLKKQGGLVKSWTLRWFTLKGDKLYYFAKEDESKCLGTISLPGNTITQHPYNADDPGKYIFELKPGKNSTNHENYLMCAATEEERKEWTSTLITVMFSRSGGAVFGQALSETMAYQRLNNKGHFVPTIVDLCCNHILTHGVEVEGIFRLPGSSRLIRILKWKFNTCEDVDLEDGVDVHTVASLLKLYLKELPEPVIPTCFYEHFMTIGIKIQHGDNQEEEMQTLIKMVDQLPPDNYNTLKHLCRFLFNVSENSSVNKMTANNLALVFGPNILRGDDDNPALLLSTADLTVQTTYVLISSYKEVFQKAFQESSAVGNFHLGKSVDFDKMYGQEAAENHDDLRHKPELLIDLSGVTDDGNEISNLPASTSPCVPLRSPPCNGDQTTAGRREKGVRHRQTPIIEDRERGCVVSPVRISNNFDEAPWMNDTDKLTPSVEHLQIQVIALKTELENQRIIHIKEKQELKEECAKVKQEFQGKLKHMDNIYKEKINDLVGKLEEEKIATAKTLQRLMSLQIQLETYKLKYGDLNDDSELQW